MESLGINTTINADCRECCPRESTCHICCLHAEVSDEEQPVEEAPPPPAQEPPQRGCIIL